MRYINKQPNSLEINGTFFGVLHNGLPHFSTLKVAFPTTDGTIGLVYIIRI